MGSKRRASFEGQAGLGRLARLSCGGGVVGIEDEQIGSKAGGLQAQAKEG